MANGVAPVCHIIRSQVLPDPIRKPIGPIRRNGDPVISQIADTIDKLADSSWKEARRNTQRVRIHNAENYNQWVEVERITRIVFENTVTGVSFEWTYKPT
jgi:hypothetical protein